MERKQRIIAALRKWVRQKPGLEFGNYGDLKVYRAEVRSIGKDLKQAEELIRAVEWRDSITADDIINAAKSNYSGRLEIEELPDGKIRMDYCKGQYWPTEYRRAVCSVLAGALWDRLFADARPPVDDHDTLTSGTWLRKLVRRELSLGVARRWFDA